MKFQLSVRSQKPVQVSSGNRPERLSLLESSERYGIEYTDGAGTREWKHKLSCVSPLFVHGVGGLLNVILTQVVPSSDLCYDMEKWRSGRR